MSIFNRIKSIMRSNQSPSPVKSVIPFEDSQINDIVNVDLQEYIVSGKVIYFDRGFAPHRYAYYLQNGKTLDLLIVEKSRTYDCYLCSFLEGALDDPNDVPTRLEIDGDIVYDLEHYRSDVSRTEGNTDFRSGDDVMFWKYIGENQQYFFLQWQDGKFVACSGTKIPTADVTFLKSSM